MLCCCFEILLVLVALVVLLLVGCRVMTILTCGGFKLTNEDLSGKHIVITGATHGIGEVSARELCAHGAEVYVLCRNTSRAETLVREWKGRCHVIHCQLDSLASVRQAAQQLLDKAPVIHVLLNNAGTGAPNPKVPKMTDDGFEFVMASNYFGHFLLTLLLLPKFEKGSRIINVSSLAHAWAKKLDVANLNFEKEYSVRMPYAHSKLAQVLFSRELANRLHPRGATVNSLHPGYVQTNIFSMDGRKSSKMAFYGFLSKFFKTAEEGAMTSLYLSVSEAVAHVSGHYFSDCAPKAPYIRALDDQLALELWDESCRLVGLQKDII